MMILTVLVLGFYLVVGGYQVSQVVSSEDVQKVKVISKAAARVLVSPPKKGKDHGKGIGCQAAGRDKARGVFGREKGKREGAK